MLNAARLAAVILFSALVAPGPVAAHLGGGAFIIVPEDQINPGASFEVIAADLGAGATVSLEIVNGERVAQLGNVSADPDGHFQTRLQLPADFPQGYAELFATSNDGQEVMTWVLVGPRTASTGLPPGQSAWWTDPSVVILGFFVIGGVLMLGYLLLRRGAPEPVPARATRRPLPSKRRRARES